MVGIIQSSDEVLDNSCMASHTLARENDCFL
jgi:hypothetical protein